MSYRITQRLEEIANGASAGGIRQRQQRHGRNENAESLSHPVHPFNDSVPLWLQLFNIFGRAPVCKKRKVTMTSISWRTKSPQRQKIDLMPRGAIQRQVGSYLAHDRRKLKAVTGKAAA